METTIGLPTAVPLSNSEMSRNDKTVARPTRLRICLQKLRDVTGDVALIKVRMILVQRFEIILKIINIHWIFTPKQVDYCLAPPTLIENIILKSFTAKRRICIG